MLVELRKQPEAEGPGSCARLMGLTVKLVPLAVPADRRRLS